MSVPALLGLAPAGTGDVQALEQVVLLAGALLLGHLPLLDGHVQGGQLVEDVVLVVELAVGLLGDLVGDPGHPAHGRQGKGEQAGDQPHAGSSSRRTNECGGSGPTYENRRRPSSPAATALAASSKRSTAPESTRNETAYAV